MTDQVRSIVRDLHARRVAEDAAARAISDALRKNDKLHSLGLDSNRIAADGARALGKALVNNETLTHLSLDRDNLNDDGACAIAKALEGNTHLRAVSLYKNGIKDEGARALGEALELNRTVQTLYLHNNGIRSEGAGSLARALEKNATLTELFLSDNDIKDDGAWALAKALENNSTLTCLDLSDNDIRSDGAWALASALEHNTRLVRLDLQQNALGDDGARSLAKALEGNMVLESLDLQQNSIGTEGARALAKALELNSTLTSLQLCGNDIGDEGAFALGKVLESCNSVLALLSLSHTGITDAGARSVARALAANTTLTSVELFNNGITVYGTRSLAEALEKNATLLSLGLHYNNINNDGARALSRALEQHNTTLTSLDLRSNPVTDDELLRFIDASLARNKRLPARAAAALARPKPRAVERPRPTSPTASALAMAVEAALGGPLHVAARMGNAAGVRALLQHGAEPCEVDANGDLALHLACRFRHAAAARALLDVSPWGVPNKGGRTAIEEALFQSGRRGLPALDDETAHMVRAALETECAGDPVREWAKERAEGARSQALDKLMAMTGLLDVKRDALGFRRSVTADLGLTVQARMTARHSMNFCFLGNPGTGKTTVARLYGELLVELGLRWKSGAGGAVADAAHTISLSPRGVAPASPRRTNQTLEDKGFVETSARALLQEGAASVAQRLSKLNGVFFVDDVHELRPAAGGEGRAITQVLMEAAERDRARLSIFVAGHAREVQERWLDWNVLLKARFPNKVVLEDLSEPQLRTLLLGMIRDSGWKLATPELEAAALGGPKRLDVASIAARRLLRQAGGRGFANARTVRALVQLAQHRASERIMNEDGEEDEEEQVGGSGARDKDAPLATLIGRDLLGAPLPPDSPLLRELATLPGVWAVKDALKKLIDKANKNFALEEESQAVLDLHLHRVFLGNAGTGKTTVARLYGRMLAKLGCLSSGELVLVGAAQLLSDALDQSKPAAAPSALQRQEQLQAAADAESPAALAAAAAVDKWLERAKGGVLAIKEAYMLCDGGGEDGLGARVIDALVERVQGAPGEDFAVLLLGFEDKMSEMVRVCNPLLARRWRTDTALVFPDYDNNELRRVMLLQAREMGLELSEELAEAAVSDVLAKRRTRPRFGNAGAVRHLLEQARESMKARLKAAGANVLGARLLGTDLMEVYQGSARDVLARLIKAEQIVKRVDAIERSIKVKKRQGENPAQLLRNWRFTGKPGTGKRTVARAFGDVFYKLGLLMDSRVVECKAAELLGSSVPGTAVLVRDKLAEAYGGVLLLHDAYALVVHYQYGRAAIETLVGELEGLCKGKLMVVLASQLDQMQIMLRENPPLERCFPEMMDFPAWEPGDCLDLLRRKCTAQKVDLPEALEPAVLEGFRRLAGLPSWGNARDACAVAERALEERDSRCDDDGFVEGPVLMEDLRKAFDALLEQRNAPIEPPPLMQTRWAEHVRRGASLELSDNASGSNTVVAIARADKPDEATLLAALERAVAALGYDLERQRDMAASRAFPRELVELVARAARSPPDKVLAMLRANCDRLLPKLDAAVRDVAAEEQLRAEAKQAVASALLAHERESLRQAERQRQLKQAATRVCFYCGRHGCHYMRKLFHWDETYAGPMVVTIPQGHAPPPSPASFVTRTPDNRSATPRSWR